MGGFAELRIEMVFWILSWQLRGAICSTSQ
jgi:hypothetical protein